MKLRQNNQNNYAFIDSQNLNLAIREQGWRLDFKKFREYLRTKYNVTKAFLFIGYMFENQPLYTALQNAGYILVFKPVLRDEGGVVIKGNVDAELVLHAMIEYPHYDQAVIITGDGDFHCLLDYFNKNNKLLRLIIPNQFKYSSLLREFIPKISFMNNQKGKLGYFGRLQNQNKKREALP